MGGCCSTKQSLKHTEAKVSPKKKYVIEIHEDICAAVPLRFTSGSTSNIDFLSVDRYNYVPNSALSLSESSPESIDKLKKLSDSATAKKPKCSPDLSQNNSPQTKKFEIAHKPNIDIVCLRSFAIREKQRPDLLFVQDRSVFPEVKHTKTMTKVYLPDGTVKINQYNLVKELKSSLSFTEFLATDSNRNNYLVTRYSSFNKARQSAQQFIDFLTALNHPSLLFLLEIIYTPKIFIVQQFAAPLTSLDSKHLQQLEALKNYLVAYQCQYSQLNVLVDADGNLKVKGSEIKYIPNS